MESLVIGDLLQRTHRDHILMVEDFHGNIALVHDARTVKNLCVLKVHRRMNTLCPACCNTSPDNMCGAKDAGYTCTRKANHEGPHICCLAIDHYAFAWPNEADPDFQSEYPDKDNLASTHLEAPSA